MPVARNRHYNDPVLGQAFGNLAQMFAPPSAQDTYALEKAAGQKLQSEALRQLLDYTTAPDYDGQRADRAATLLGIYNPTQSWRALDMNDATTRRGQDVTAYTSRANNAADNQQRTITSLYGALDPGQVRPAIPAAIAGTQGLPGIDAAVGAPKPPTESEWQAAQNERLRQGGQLTDDMLLDTIIGKETPVKVIGPDGKTPVYQSPGAAVRTGAQPAGEGKDIAFDNYLVRGPDNEQSMSLGRVSPDGRIVAPNGEDITDRVLRKTGTGGNGLDVEMGRDGNLRIRTGDAAGNTVSSMTELQGQTRENERGAQELISLFGSLRQDDLGLAGNLNETVRTNVLGQVAPGMARPDVTARRNQLRAASANLAKAIMNDGRLSDTERAFAREIAVSDGVDVSLPGAQAQLAQLTVLLRWQEDAARAQAGGQPVPPRDLNYVGALVDAGRLPPTMADVYLRTMGGQSTPRPVDGPNTPRPPEPPSPPSPPSAPGSVDDLVERYRSR